MNAEQAKNLLERVAALEQKERNYAQDILNLNRDNHDLRKRVDSSEKKYDELKEKFDDIGNVGTGVDTMTASLRTLTTLQELFQDEPEEESSSLTKDLVHQFAQTKDSIFCADLITEKPLKQQNKIVKVNKCASVLGSSTGPFNSQSGILKPNHDGIYHLAWKIHQKGDGKISFIMAIDGMKGRIYLGTTFEAGGICSGTLIVPLKTEQRVWIEAKLVAGPDAQVYGCNFMGWLMQLHSFSSLESIGNLQQSLFSSIVNDCQHL